MTETAPLGNPTVGLYLGSYGGPRGGLARRPFIYDPASFCCQRVHQGTAQGYLAHKKHPSPRTQNTPQSLRLNLETTYFTKLCSGSEAGSYSRLIDFVYHTTLGLKVITRKEEKKRRTEFSMESPVMNRESVLY